MRTKNSIYNRIAVLFPSLLKEQQAALVLPLQFTRRTKLSSFLSVVLHSFSFTPFSLTFLPRTMARNVVSDGEGGFLQNPKFSFWRKHSQISITPVLKLCVAFFDLIFLQTTWSLKMRRSGNLRETSLNAKMRRMKKKVWFRSLSLFFLCFRLRNRWLWVCVIIVMSICVVILFWWDFLS